jgi:ferrous iron transport protein A
MAESHAALASLADVIAPVAAPTRAPDHLGALSPGGCGRIVELVVAPDECAMLRAMGIAEGQEVRVLRRAPTGDPVHVRLGSGGEFAIARPLARAVRIERLP